MKTRTLDWEGVKHHFNRRKETVFESNVDIHKTFEGLQFTNPVFELEQMGKLRSEIERKKTLMRPKELGMTYKEAESC
jgi:hypothetical protein